MTTPFLLFLLAVLAIVLCLIGYRLKSDRLRPAPRLIYLDHLVVRPGLRDSSRPDQVPDRVVKRTPDWLPMIARALAQSRLRVLRQPT